MFFWLVEYFGYVMFMIYIRNIKYIFSLLFNTSWKFRANTKGGDLNFRVHNIQMFLQAMGGDELSGKNNIKKAMNRFLGYIKKW